MTNCPTCGKPTTDPQSFESRSQAFGEFMAASINKNRTSEVPDRETVLNQTNANNLKES